MAKHYLPIIYVVGVNFHVVICDKYLNWRPHIYHYFHYVFNQLQDPRYQFCTRLLIPRHSFQWLQDASQAGPNSSNIVAAILKDHHMTHASKLIFLKLTWQDNLGTQYSQRFLQFLFLFSYFFRAFQNFRVVEGSVFPQQGEFS